MRRGLKRAAGHHNAVDERRRTDLPDEEGTETWESALLRFPAAPSRTDLPDEEGTETRRRSGYINFKILGRTDLPDEEGTETIAEVSHARVANASHRSPR